MNYIATQINHDKLMRDIEMAQSLIHPVYYTNIILAIGSNTIETLEKASSMPKNFFSQINTLKKYCGYKVLVDDELEYGEIKILTEINVTR
jgi:hypothetical protein